MSSSDDDQYGDYHGYDEHDQDEVEDDVPEAKERKTRRPRRKKDPNKPRGALTPYMCYSKQVRPAIMQQFPNAPITEIAKKIGLQWRSLTDAEKQPYVEMAKVDRQRFKDAMEHYVPTPGFEVTRGRRKRRKDPNAPKKPKSAYFLFAEARRGYFRQKFPSAKVSEIAKRTGEEWRGLSEDQKKPYYDRAEILKQAYAKAVSAYRGD